MKEVYLELGGEKRRLALDLNAQIALRRVSGKAPIDLMMEITRVAAAQEEAKKEADKAGTNGHSAEAQAKLKAAADEAELVGMESMRQMVWAMVASDNPEFQRDPRTINEVGKWFGTIEDVNTISRELTGVFADYMKGLKGANGEYAGQLAPFVPTPTAVVASMIELAELQPNETVIDLGAGDGRLMFAALEVHDSVMAFGYEMHLERCTAIRALIRGHKHGNRAMVFHADAREAKLEAAHVVFLYLLQSSNAELKQKLVTELAPDSRVISHDFSMPDWEPDAQRSVQCGDPACIKPNPHSHTVYRWRVPVAPAANA